jgi:hypothetical protein
VRDVEVKGNDKGPDVHETEAKSAVVLKAKIVIPGRPEGSRGETRAPVSFLHEPPAPVPQPLFHLFYLVEIRHRQLLPSQLHPLTGANPRRV